MPNFQIRSPILRKYWSKDKTCIINQLYAANLISYKTKGHTGIDFKTQGVFQYMTSKMSGLWNRQKSKAGGTIPIQATHDGFLTKELNHDKDWGISMRIETAPMEEDGQTVKYETFYFHLDSVIRGKGDKEMTSWEKEFGENFIKEGTIIGYGGNTGKLTTGAHLHFELRKFVKVGDVWINPNIDNGYNGCIDPMPYFMDYCIFETGPSGMKSYYHKGEKINLEILKSLTK